MRLDAPTADFRRTVFEGAPEYSEPFGKANQAMASTLSRHRRSTTGDSSVVLDSNEGVACALGHYDGGFRTLSRVTKSVG